jgi:hypothetical protein
MRQYDLVRDEDYLYPILGSPGDYCFYAGNTKDGMQVLAVIVLPSFVGVLFDASGRPREVEEYPFSSGQTTVVTDVEEREVQSWLEEVGYQEALITVRRFFLPDHQTGIKDLPEYYRDILLHPEKYSSDEFDHALTVREGWAKEGLYVLWLNEYTDVWIDHTGTIIAT